LRKRNGRPPRRRNQVRTLSRVTLSPHNAADTDPDAISVYVADQIAAFERGEALDNVVDRSAGY